MPAADAQAGLHVGPTIAHALDIPGSLAFCMLLCSEGCSSTRLGRTGKQECRPPSLQSSDCTQVMLHRKVLAQAKATGEALQAAQSHMHPFWQGGCLLLVSGEGC